MKIKEDKALVIVGFVALFAIALSAFIFDFDEVVMASFEGEPSEDEIWTNLNVDYRYSMDTPMATVTVDFHNNKVFEECYYDVGVEDYCRTYNFTSFDFRLRSVEETAAYPAGLRSYSDNGVELLRGESYNVRFRVRDDLIEGEPIKVEFTARGYEEDGTGKTIEENLAFTLEPPVYDDQEEETPGFTFVFAIFIVLFTSYIVNKKR